MECFAVIGKITGLRIPEISVPVLYCRTGLLHTSCRCPYYLSMWREHFSGIVVCCSTDTFKGHSHHAAFINALLVVSAQYHGIGAGSVGSLSFFTLIPESDGGSPFPIRLLQQFMKGAESHKFRP